MRPWLDEGDAPPELVELLQSARKSRPLDAAMRARSARRLSALSALPAAAGALFWAPHAALGAALGAVVTTAVVVPRILHTPAPAPVVAERVPSPPTRPKEREQERPAAPPAPGASAAEHAVPAAPPSGAIGRLPVARESGEHDLSREARALESARELLARSPAQALSLLSRHEREFPDGTLAVERELLTVDALLRLGRRSEAEARGRALRGRAPSSLYERRLEKMLGGVK
jgi:hypothetical protein